MSRTTTQLLWFLGTVVFLIRPVTGFDVSVVPSDAVELAASATRTGPLSSAQIEAMTRRAVDLVGGMSAFVDEDAALVALKVNISVPESSGSGIVTDARVARAVALLVHEVAPQARILIAEGAGGWISPAMRDRTNVRGGSVEDGFAVAGHRETVAELRAMGIDIDCFDLNFDRAYDLRPEGGALAHEEYSIAAAIIDADTWINIPVAKTHGAKITCSLKNHFGILPGTIYGWSKSTGTAQHGPMPHSPRVLDEAWIDLYNVSRVDLNVVDMIRGSETGPFEKDNTHRSNTILAGANPIATDLVVAKLMGFNPDDFEFAALAARRGLGPRFIEDVQILGVEDPTALVSRWKKAGVTYGGGRGEWGQHANYGMGPREWTLLGPLPRDHAFDEEQLKALSPVPGEEGWSPLVWFGHDKIDLDKQYDDPVNCAVYGFTEFTMATSDSVRIWLGSDEELSVWLDGELIYEHNGRRRHNLGMVKLPGFIEAGKHRLLIRAGQGRGDFDFSINICEPIDDVLYHGNRYPGVRYNVGDSASPAVLVAAEDVGGWGTTSRDEFSLSTINLTDPLLVSQTAPDTILVDGVTPRSRDLLSLLVELSDSSAIESPLLQAMGSRPFSIGYGGRGRENWTPAYGPDFSRLLGWLGLDYAVYYGLGMRESLKTIQGLLAQGHIPVTTTMERRQRRRRSSGGGSRWTAIDGYRTDGEIIEVRQAGRGRWVQARQDWTGILPSGNEENCPLLIARASPNPLTPSGLIDILAALAVEQGRSGVIKEEDSWGERLYPRGLAAWDAWVTDWERRPFTAEWATSPRPLDQLEGMRRRVLLPLIQQRKLASQCFASAAGSAEGERGRALKTAEEGYARVADVLERLVTYLPSEDRLDELTRLERRMLGRLPEAKPLLREARAAEREALAALVSVVGGAPLAPIREDRWHDRDQGIKLFTWTAVTDDSVYDLVYEEGELQMTLLEGDEAKHMSFETHNVLPETPGWEVAVEIGIDATGLYTIIEQPHADNDWRVVVRADDDRVWRDNAPQLVVWAVPSGQISQ